MRIHLWDSGALERELAANHLGERERATYLTIGWALSVLIGYSTLTFSNVSRSWLGLAEGLSLVFVIIWGFRYGYLSNGGSQGRDFVVRFTCLFVPVGIKVQLLVWIAYYLFGWAFQATIPGLSFGSKENADAFISFSQSLPTAITYLAQVGSYLLIFIVIAIHLKRISRGTPPR